MTRDNRTLTTSRLHWTYILKSLVRQKSGLVGCVVITLVVVAALFPNQLGSGDPNAIMLQNRLAEPLSRTPTGWNLLGTDALGRDIFTRMLYGARVSLLVSTTAVLISAFLGVSLGLLAGFYRGWLDAVLMRLAEIQLAFPFILLALTLLATLGSGLPQLVLVLGIGRWVVFARLVRTETLSMKEKEFIEASVALGSSNLRIMLRHLLPNTFAPIIVAASFTVATNILTEASLSFIGLGLDISIPTWGRMLAEGRDYLPGAWWLATFPGIAILVTVLGINLFGDWLRDFLDPKLKL